MSLAAFGSQAQAQAQSILSNTKGEQKTAVILVNFEDDASQPITLAAAHALVFGTVSDFYWEASYQSTFLSGDTLGWYTVPVSKTTCGIDRIATEADRLATAAGADLAKYSRLIYLMPDNACMGAGFNSGPTLPTRMWVTSNNINAQLITHELGHNFGLLHAQSLDCGSSELGANCTSSSYGDPADTMGSGFTAHFNATLKESLGWIATSGQPPITTITASGNYGLAPFEINGTSAKALKVPRGVDPGTGEMSYYYIEYRQPTGFDTGLGSVGNLTAGVLVHIGGINQPSVLLDMTPDSFPDSSFHDMRDAALVVGRSYTDTSAGITITLQSANADGAVVEVRLDGSPTPVSCTRAPPQLTVAGPTAAVVAGSTVTSTVNLSNRDSGTCSATTFSLARTVPDGWTGSLGVSQLSLSPGASAGTTLKVTSPATASTGSYAIGVGTGSGVGSIHAVNASYVHSVTATGAALTGSVGTDKAVYARGETVHMSARVLANGVPVSGANVRFSVTMPRGDTVLTATSGSDGFARSSLKVGKGKAAIGGYQLRADASSGGATATATTSFSVR